MASVPARVSADQRTEVEHSRKPGYFLDFNHVDGYFKCLGEHKYTIISLVYYFEAFCTHVVDPVDVGADPGEDRGLLVVVAAHAGAKAHHTVHIPGAIGVLAVQGTAGVSLDNDTHRETRLRLPLGLPARL